MQNSPVVALINQNPSPSVHDSQNVAVWQERDIWRSQGHQHHLHTNISKLYTNFDIKIMETEILVFSPHPFLKPLLLTPDFLHQTHTRVLVENEDSWSRRSESLGVGVTEHRAPARSGTWPALRLGGPPPHLPSSGMVTCPSPVQDGV